MIFDKKLKRLSYLKALSAGEAKILVQDIRCSERTQETLALLKILALGEKEVERNELTSTKDAREKSRNRLLT